MIITDLCKAFMTQQDVVTERYTILQEIKKLDRSLIEQHYVDHAFTKI